MALPNSEIGNRKSEIGFTLIEVLLAMFILALGMVAIASVFPVGGYLQKQYYDEVTSNDLNADLDAIIPARGFFGNPTIPSNDLEDSWVASPSALAGMNPNSVFDLLDALLDSDPANAPNPGASIQWPLSMRSFPVNNDADGDGVANEPDDPAAPMAQWADDLEDPLYFRRDFYWVPLARDNNGGVGNRKWEIFIFILRKQPEANYDYTGNGYPNNNNWRRLSNTIFWANWVDGQENPLEPGAMTANTRWHVPAVRRYSLPNAAAARIPNIAAANYPTYPTVVINQAGLSATNPISKVVRVGDWILGDNGTPYQVIDIPAYNRLTLGPNTLGDATALPDLRIALRSLWIAVPAVAEQASPTIRILGPIAGDAIK